MSLAPIIDAVSQGLVAIERFAPAAEQRPVAPAVEPTYADTSISLVEAEQAIDDAIRDVLFGKILDQVHQQRAANNHLLAFPNGLADGHGFVCPPERVSYAFQVTVGAGKSTSAMRAVAELVGRRILPELVRLHVVTTIAVPRHDLGDQLAQVLASHGVNARVYRGYEADDPDGAPGSNQKMCLTPDAVADARRAGRRIFTSVCKTKAAECPFFNQCASMKQRRAEPDVWIVPHSLLYFQRPAFIPKPEILIIDETFYGPALDNKATRLTLDDLAAPTSIPSDTDSSVRLVDARRMLLDRLGSLPAGPVPRDAVKGLPENIGALERKRLMEADITPGMDPKTRHSRAKKVASQNAKVIALATLWDEVDRFRAEGGNECGRILVDKDTISVRPLNTAHFSWDAPSLVLDATLPSQDILETALTPVPQLPHRIEILPPVSVEWSRHVTVRQILGAPESATKLGIGQDSKGSKDKRNYEDGKRNRAAIMRFIRLRAAGARAGRVLVVGQKDLLAELQALGSPPNVVWAHMGALADVTTSATSSA